MNPKERAMNCPTTNRIIPGLWCGESTPNLPLQFGGKPHLNPI